MKTIFDRNKIVLISIVSIMIPFTDIGIADDSYNKEYAVKKAIGFLQEQGIKFSKKPKVILSPNKSNPSQKKWLVLYKDEGIVSVNAITGDIENFVDCRTKKDKSNKNISEKKVLELVEKAIAGKIPQGFVVGDFQLSCTKEISLPNSDKKNRKIWHCLAPQLVGDYPVESCGFLISLDAYNGGIISISKKFEQLSLPKNINKVPNVEFLLKEKFGDGSYKVKNKTIYFKKIKLDPPKENEDYKLIEEQKWERSKNQEQISVITNLETGKIISMEKSRRRNEKLNE